MLAHQCESSFGFDKHVVSFCCRVRKLALDRMPLAANDRTVFELVLTSIVLSCTMRGLTGEKTTGIICCFRLALSLASKCS